MKWSWKLGQFFGIGVFVHWTFSLLLIWLVALYILRGDTLATAVEGIAFVLAIFACVVLHEFGHALTARRFGVGTRDITLLPIGGVARLERMPEEPMQEFWIAVAGPAVNVVLAVVLFAGLLGMEGLNAATDVSLVGGGFLAKLLYVNIALVVFNMLPAFPMDGGRVLRALLARKMDYVRATQIAASTGQGMAIFFALLGFFVNWFLLFIALFVYLGAQQEAHMVQIRSLLRGVPVREAMITRFRTFSASDPVSAAIGELLAGEQQDFPVVEADRIAGLLTRADLLRAVADNKQEAPIREYMQHDVPTVAETEMLDGTFAGMQQGTCSSLPVVRDGRLVGIVNLENIGEWMMIQSALRQARARSEVESIYRPG